MSARRRADHPAALLLTASLVLLCCLWAQRPPAPLPVDAPATSFSAHRATRTLDVLLGDTPARPRPTGSVAHAAARARLVEQLKALGLKPRAVRRRLCQRICAEVESLIVPVLPGDGPAIILSAHDDSVLAGPGVSDDLAGVAATLEIARALRATPPQERPRHPVTLWITDGEELGLLGAHALEGEGRGHFVINLEARGTTGRSFAFETGSAQAETLTLVARSSRRPALNTIADEVYRRLPNSTDLAVHMAHGRQGVNLGYFGEVSRYHTPRDDRAHLDEASLQHSGEQALALTRALGRLDRLPVVPDDADTSRVVAADVLGLAVAMWPQGVTVWLALLALAMWLVVLIRWWRLGALFWREIFYSGVVWALVWGGGVGVGALLEVALRLVTAHPAPWRGAWEVALLMYTCAIGAVALGVMRALGRRASASGLWLAGGLALVGLALASARWMEAGSAVCVLAALAWSASGLALGWRAHDHEARGALWLVSWALAALLWLPLTLTLQAALELPLSVVFTAPVALLAALALPALHAQTTRHLSRAGIAAALASLLGALVVALPPHATDERPEPLGLMVHHPAHGPPQQLLIRPPLTLTVETAPLPPPQALARTLPPAERPLKLPFYVGEVSALPLPAQDAPPRPVVEVLGELPNLKRGARLIRVRSQREATTLLLHAPRGALSWLPIQAATLTDAQVLDAMRPHDDQGGACHALGGRCLTIPSHGVLTGAHPTRGVRLLHLWGDPERPIQVSDLTPGLPEAMDGLTVRPSWAVGAHLGDAVVVDR